MRERSRRGRGSGDHRGGGDWNEDSQAHGGQCSQKERVDTDSCLL